MTPPDEQPVAFERRATAKAAGCLAYALMIPVVAIIGGLVGGCLAAGLMKLLQVRENAEAGGLVLLVFAFAGMVGGAAFGIRDFRRRSGGKILVYEDRLEAVHGGMTEPIPYEELEWISGPSLAFLARSQASPLQRSLFLTLKRKNRRRLHLRSEEWPLPEIAAALQKRAVPPMARLFGDRLDAGEVLEFRPGRLQAVRYLVSGVVLFGLGATLFVFWAKQLWIEKKYQATALPMLLTLAGASSLVMAFRSRGGVLLERTGLRARPQDRLILWEQIRNIQMLPDVMNIVADDGTVISVGMMARNYDACVELIRRRRPAGA